jgi:hypothetical protein
MRGPAPTLNATQRAALDGLHEDCRVVGWDREFGGPLVRLADGSVKVLAPAGNLLVRTKGKAAA